MAFNKLNNLRTEKEIIQNWKGDLSKPLVSISCITFNHERYIEDALNGFLIQETDFPFEILIHDDASTDGTGSIIREYESKYFNIIKPIYQTENQYSKGIKISFAFNFPRATGKYIAMCEGDDYWTDPYKLQKQVDYITKHPECAMCFSAATIITRDDKKTGKFIRPNQGDRIFTIEDMILGGGGFFHTGSVLFRKNLVDNFPQWYCESSIGDYPLGLICAINGTVAYIDEIMSVYRRMSVGSWSESIANKKEKNREHLRDIVKMLNSFNRYTAAKYEMAVVTQIDYYKKILFLSLEDRDCLKDPQNEEILRCLLFHERVKFLSRLYFPRIYNLLAQLKHNLLRQ